MSEELETTRIEPTGKDIHEVITTAIAVEENWIKEKFDSSMEKAESMLATTTSVLADLSDAMDEWQDLQLFYVPIYNPVSFYFIPGDLPEVPEPHYSTADSPDEPTLIEVDMPEVNVPDVEGYLTVENMLYTADQIYDTSTYEAVQNKLLSDLANGATGLNASVEADIFNRDFERAFQEYQDTRERVISEWSSRGFDLPNGMLTSQLYKVESEYSNKRYETSKDIAIKQAELAFQNSQFVIQQLIASSQFITNFRINLWAGMTNIAQTMVSIADIVSKIELSKTTAQLAYNKGLLDIYIAEVDAWKSIIGMSLEKAKNEITLYEQQVRAYGSKVQALATVADVDVKVGDMRNTQVTAEASFNIEKAKLFLAQQTTKLQLRIQAINAVATITSQLAAGMYSGVSVSASAQQNISASEQFQRNNSINEDF